MFLHLIVICERFFLLFSKTPILINSFFANFPLHLTRHFDNSSHLMRCEAFSHLRGAADQMMTVAWSSSTDSGGAREKLKKSFSFFLSLILSKDDSVYKLLVYWIVIRCWPPQVFKKTFKATYHTLSIWLEMEFTSNIFFENISVHRLITKYLNNK